MNIAALSRGKYISLSWRELCESASISKNQEDGDKIAKDVIQKAGLLFGGD